MNRSLLAVALMALAMSAPALAEDTATKSTATPAEAAATTAAPEHRTYSPATLKWVDAPPAFPKGAKMTVLFGNPEESGPFTLRVKVPAGYRVMPHYHPADENMTVLNGEVYMALGDKFDESKGHALGVGSFSTMPMGTHHYAWTKTGATFQVHGMGPFSLTYVNPADDPRTAKAVSK
jgi:mannose-6-phosphate isomerase-like protein (cupin superfamily)